MWDRFIAALANRRWLTLLVGALLVAGSAALAPGIAFSSDVTEHMPKVSAPVTAWLELSRRFDAFNSLIIGLEEPNAPLTAEGLASLKQVTDRLAAQKAAGVLSVSSVANVDSITEGEDGSLETELLIPKIPTGAAGLEALGRKIAANVQVSGALISRDQRGYMVLVRGDPRKDPAELAALVQKTVEESRGALVPSYFGAAFFSAVITRGVYAKLTWLVPAFAVLLFGALALLARRWRACALVLGCAVLSLVVWLGIVRALGLVLSFTSLTALLGVLALAAIVYARGLDGDDANPLPGPLIGALAAAGLAALPLKLLPFAYVANFGVGMAVGALAVLLVGLFVFVPLHGLAAPRVDVLEGSATPPGAGLLAGTVAVVVLAGVVASQAHFFATPQTMFRDGDEIGRSLAFFDRRFGGPDFIQVDFQGDLRDPDVAARLMRLTDLLEGSGAFPDVRSVTQVLGFLNNGFGGVHRVPTTRESLGNLWFFLEGRPDVRNLVSDARDEAMAVLRVPSKPSRPMNELVGVVDAAVKDSLQVGAAGAKLRLIALAKAMKVPLADERVDAVLAAATAPLSPEDQAALDAEIRENVRDWLATPDSPFQPTDDEWKRMEAALSAPEAERGTKLTEVAKSIPALSEHAEQLVDTVLARERDHALSVRAAQLAGRLGVEDATFKLRAVGALCDLLDPHAHAGESAKVTISGLPVVAEQIERDLLRGLWTALAMLLGLGAVLLLLVTRNPGDSLRALLAAAAATAVTVAAAGTLGFGVDSGSASLFLVPPLASLVAFGAPRTTRLRAAFLVAIGAASLALLLVGLAPMSRIATVMAIGLGATAVATQLLGRRVR